MATQSKSLNSMENPLFKTFFQAPDPGCSDKSRKRQLFLILPQLWLEVSEKGLFHIDIS